MNTPMHTPLSPFDIEVLLWYHCRGYAMPSHSLAPALAGSPLHLEASLRMWQAAGMLEPKDELHGPTFDTTAKGKAMVAALCSTPKPKQRWVDAQGRPLRID